MNLVGLGRVVGPSFSCMDRADIQLRKKKQVEVKHACAGVDSAASHPHAHCTASVLPLLHSHRHLTSQVTPAVCSIRYTRGVPTPLVSLILPYMMSLQYWYVPIAS